MWLHFEIFYLFLDISFIFTHALSSEIFKNRQSSFRIFTVVLLCLEKSVAAQFLEKLPVPKRGHLHRISVPKNWFALFLNSALMIFLKL